MEKETIKLGNTTINLYHFKNDDNHLGNYVGYKTLMEISNSDGKVYFLSDDVERYYSDVTQIDENFAKKELEHQKIS